MKLETLLWLGMFGVILTSCSPTAKLRRAKRLISEAEAAGIPWHVDTVFQEVQVEVPKIHVDTVVKVQSWLDTIIVTKDRLVTRVQVRPEEKIVYIESNCDSAVVVKKVPVQVYRDIKVGFSKMGLVWRVLLALIVGFTCGYFIEKFRK